MGLSPIAGGSLKPYHYRGHLRTIDMTMNQQPEKSESPISSPAHKRPRTIDEQDPQPARFEEEFVPIYKAYRKSQIGLSKPEHQH